MTTQQMEQAAYSLSFSPQEVALLRASLTELLRIYTRHEHVYGAVQSLLAKLPDVPMDLWAREK